MITIEEAIEEVHKAGFKVNNLFEFNSIWQANITDGELFYEFGHGMTPSEALSNALHKKGEGKRAKQKEAAVGSAAIDDLITKGL